MTFLLYFVSYVKEIYLFCTFDGVSGRIEITKELLLTTKERWNLQETLWEEECLEANQKPKEKKNQFKVASNLLEKFEQMDKKNQDENIENEAWSIVFTCVPHRIVLSGFSCNI